MAVIGKISRKEAYLISLKVVRDNKTKEESINEVCPHLKNIELMPWDMCIVDSTIDDTKEFIDFIKAGGISNLDGIDFEQLAEGMNSSMTAPEAYETVLNYFIDK